MTAYSPLLEGWETVSEYPPEFGECGACYGLIVDVSASEGVPYGYCQACESTTTWAMVRRSGDAS